MSKIEENKKEIKEFENLCRPLIKWLNDNYHPHVTILITPINAELLEGIQSTGIIHDYIRD